MYSSVKACKRRGLLGWQVATVGICMIIGGMTVLQGDSREEAPFPMCTKNMSASASLDPHNCEKLSQKCIVKAVLGTS